MLDEALLVISFGGPGAPEEVMPFLRNVVRGRGVPEARLQEVAARYQRFGGVSPIRAQTQALVDAIQREMPDLPVYLGNRNWHPFLSDTVAQMAEDGVERARAFATSAYSSYSSCRQYLEDITRARSPLGARAPEITKIPPFSEHPGFIEANRDRLKEALRGPGSDAPTILFTAHSLPAAMASRCRYEEELRRTGSKILEGIEPRLDSRLVFQSRSGPPSVPWLEPDVLDALRDVAGAGVEDVVLAPIGFVSDHMEVAYDLDVEAKELAGELGLTFRRAATVGTHPRFIEMIRELVEAEVTVCAPDCCPSGRRERGPK